MNEYVMLLVKGLVLGLVCVGLWHIKVYVIGGVMLYMFSMYIANAAYKKAMGKDMAAYTRLLQWMK